jgi:hypothetical protein
MERRRKFGRRGELRLRFAEVVRKAEHAYRQIPPAKHSELACPSVLAPVKSGIGNLGAGQSNVRFPIALSYSNRTELIDKPDWRGQVGVSYDFDALFAKR